MRSNCGQVRQWMAAASLLGALAGYAQQPVKAHAPRSPAHSTVKAEPLRKLNNEEKAQQMLNRFTFGARPGDLEAVEHMGVDAWFEQQLDPQKVADPVLGRRLADFPALNLAPEQLLYNFPMPQTLRQVEDGKRPYPEDAMLKGLYEVQLYKYDQRQEKKQGNAAAMNDDEKRAQRMRDRAAAVKLAQQILAQPKAQRMAAIMKLSVEDRIALAKDVQDPEKAQLEADFHPREREIFRVLGGGPDAMAVVDNELQQAKLLRAILSERQLQEVMTDFWFNHFNVFLHKETDQAYTPGYERDAIRAHALGKFRDLLLATAQHPAMLVYLDNWQSIGPNSDAALRARQRKQERGLNENYGREVMELHTVGVDGGYSQADVTNLAKILTGWTIDKPQQGGGFQFDPRRHEPGTKKWFGQTIHEDGYNEGVRALSWLASQPQTAHFISYKLAQRFVADDPPPALVDRMAKTFLASDGDIKEVLRTMVHAPEFFSHTYYDNKVKTPLEFVASAFRATGTDPANPAALAATLREMGEPLYQMQPPTGYPMTEEHWMNSTALVERLNFSLSLTSNHLDKTPFDAPKLVAAGLLARPASDSQRAETGRQVAISESKAATPSGSEEALRLMEQTLLGGSASTKTNDVIRRQLASLAQPGSDPGGTLSTMAALILGSPEFQMR